MTNQEQNAAFFNTLAVVGTVLGALSLYLDFVSVLRQRSSGAGLGSLEPPTGPLGVNIPRVHYQDGQVLVSVRNPGEWHEMREFIQPGSPDVIRIVRSFHG